MPPHVEDDSSSVAIGVSISISYFIFIVICLCCVSKFCLYARTCVITFILMTPNQALQLFIQDILGCVCGPYTAGEIWACRQDPVMNQPDQA